MSTYNIDPAHSNAAFKVRHLMISNVKGEFAKVKGSAEFDPAGPTTARIEAAIDVNSINTREPDRDTHLKSADFFDAANFPEITFRSTRVTPESDNEFKVTGDLTIRGTTREVTLDVETTPEIKDPWGMTRFGATASTKIKRKEFGLHWNQALETGGVVVGDEVQITLDVELVKAA